MSHVARPGDAPPYRWGVGVLLVLAVAVGAVFGLRPPHLHPPFVLHATVRSDASLRKGSAVRIAGVLVGKVTDMQQGPRGSHAAIISMQIASRGLPLHSDARAKLRPQLVLEGNFFVDLSPGTPGAPTLHSGDTLGADAVSGPVQLDRVLSDLRKPTRTSLQGFLRGYGAALGGTPGDRGRTGGQSLNDSLRDSPAALGDTAIVTQASLGSGPDDFSRGIGGTGRLLAGLARDDRQLAGLVSNLDTTVSALASRAPQLRQTVVSLQSLLRVAEPSLTALDRSLPPLGSLARALVPGTRRLNGVISVSLPWLRQATALVSESELGGLSRDLQPVVVNTAQANATLRGLTAATDGVSVCLLKRILPIGDQSVVDPPLTTGVPVRVEGLQSFEGLNGAMGGFDANGSYLRSQAGGGTVPVKSTSLPTQGPAFGNADVPPLGTRPLSPGTLPPVRVNARCTSTPTPSLRAAGGVGP